MKNIPHCVVCPMASCTRSNTCARYAQYVKALANADTFEVLNVKHLVSEGEKCPYHLVAEKQVWARGFLRIYNTIPSGRTRYFYSIRLIPVAGFIRQGVARLTFLLTYRNAFSPSSGSMVLIWASASTVMKRRRFWWKNKNPMDVQFKGNPDINVEVQKKVPDASRTRDFKILILIYEVQSVLEHGCL